MTKQDLELLIKSGDVDKLISTLNTHAVVKGIEEALKQFDPKKHAIFDATKRKDKNIHDDKGEVVDVKKVARIPLALQKKIVTTAVHFLGVPELDANPLSQKEKDLITILNKIRKDNKLKWNFKKLAKKTKSEKHAAALWYTVPAEPEYWKGQPIRESASSRFKMKILSPSLGDDLYPCWDDYGGMLAFGRGYKLKNEKGEDVEYFDLDTEDYFYYAKKVNGKWQFSSDSINYADGFQQGQVNTIGKIRYIYYPQPITDWEDSQECIEALEVIVSDHNDTNKYNGNPIVFAEGEVEGFSDKGETGKLLQGKNGAKVSYLTWDSAPESIRMEIDNLLKFIFMMTHTVETSLESLKTLGYFSITALQTLFMDAHIKAADSEEIFGEGQQREINYLRHAITVIDPSFKDVMTLDISPKFTYFLPSNFSEMIDTLSKAVDKKLLSRDSAIRQNTLVVDPDAEIAAIDTEQKEADEREAKKAEQATAAKKPFGALN